MSVEIRDDRFRAVVGEKISFERLGTGFVFTEGAAWHPRERHLVFSDIPNNRLHRWSGSGGIESFRQPSNKANGNTYDRAGRLLSCEHTTSLATSPAPHPTE
jgi:gluconolactonase